MRKLSYDAVYADLETQIADMAVVRSGDTVILMKPAGATEAQYLQATSELGFNRIQEKAYRL
jgi:hypothetical protein